jgi:hypothetical protein
MSQLSEQTPTVASGQMENRAPRQVFLFSGHMVTRSIARSPPRFPPDKEPLAAAASSKLLNELGAGATDAAISSGACGGDLLFAESCLQRRLRVEIYLPFVGDEFLKESINFAGDHWQQKFLGVKERFQDWHIMSHDLGPTPTGEDPFACVNLWMLDHALAYGTRKVSFICLRDRQAGDAPGGTKHLHDVVVQGSGNAYVLNTTQLW